ncbi:MAG: glycosyltransferase [Nanoarchaeota archaeon]
MKEINFVSVIIPALNEERYIKKCLFSLSCINTPRESFEIILVDNGSDDATREIAKKYTENVFLVPQINISALRNFGAKHSRGEILAFLDADCVVEKEWLNNAVRHFKDLQIAAVGSFHKIPDDASWVARAWYQHDCRNEEICFTNYLPSGNIFVRRDYFSSIKGFNEKLNVSEDTDLCFRLRKENYKILLDKSISAIHLGVPTGLLIFFKKELWHGKDVFRIFLYSKLKREYSKVIGYALFYVFIILLSFLATLYLNFRLLAMLIFLSFLIPFLLSLKVAIKNKLYKYVLCLGVLYLVYGLARAFCIINLKNWAVLKKR